MIAVMWKPAAAVTILTMAGATAHAQQQQSPIENLDKTISQLAQEGYEIKAAEDLSEDMPKFVLQKEESIVLCRSSPAAVSLRQAQKTNGRRGEEFLKRVPT